MIKVARVNRVPRQIDIMNNLQNYTDWLGQIVTMSSLDREKLKRNSCTEVSYDSSTRCYQKNLVADCIKEKASPHVMKTSLLAPKAVNRHG